jgi:hypothetical protein
VVGGVRTGAGARVVDGRESDGGSHGSAGGLGWPLRIGWLLVRIVALVGSRVLRVILSVAVVGGHALCEQMTGLGSR